MQVLTESMLRSALPGCAKTYDVAPNTYITETARRYAAEQKIELRMSSYGVMSRTPIDTSSPMPYMDAATGQVYSSKPEDMTHLRGNMLVHKTNPRIALRGQLDLLQGEIIRLQVLAEKASTEQLAKDLDELLQLVRNLLAAEVKDQPLGQFILWGMNEEQLRRASHNVKASVGIDHPIPDHRMGRLCVELNLLRTRVREVELCAARAFHGEEQRNDIILALNRLSSAVYLLFCKEVKNHG